MKIKFTPREKQIVDRIVQAQLRKKIAAELNISIHTVDAHINKIHAKTGTTTAAELILYVASSKEEHNL